jgi:hypothetical protein
VIGREVISVDVDIAYKKTVKELGDPPDYTEENLKSYNYWYGWRFANMFPDIVPAKTDNPYWTMGWEDCKGEET